MTEINPGYVNHIGSCSDAAGNIFAIITQDGPISGGDDTDAIVRRCAANADPELAASWVEVGRFPGLQYGKHGYCTAEVRGADLVCILSEKNAAGAVGGRVRMLRGVASGVPSGGTVDTLVRNVLKAVRTALAPIP